MVGERGSGTLVVMVYHGGLGGMGCQNAMVDNVSSMLHLTRTARRVVPGCT